MINWLTNPRLNMLPDKWRFDISQDWEILGDDFDSVSSDSILGATIQALGFHQFPLDYFKERAPRFVDLTDKLSLAIEPKDDGQPITNPKDENVRKKLECAAKKKARRNNLCALVWQALAASFAAFWHLVPLYYLVFLCLLCHLVLDRSFHWCLIFLCLLYCLILLCLLNCLVFLCPFCCFLLCLLCCFFLCPHWRLILCSVQLQLGLHFQLSKHSNKPCQMSFWALDQPAPALQNLFIRFRCLAFCPRKVIVSGFLT